MLILNRVKKSSKKTISLNNKNDETTFNIEINIDVNINIQFKELKKQISIINTELSIDCHNFDNEILKIILRAFDFEKYNLGDFKTIKKEKDYILDCINMDDNLYNELIIEFESFNLIRKLQDMPPNICNAIYMADIFSNRSKKIENLEIKVLNKKQIEDLGMGLLLAVNKGSLIEPRVVILEYKPNNTKEYDVAFVGKGITMDTGGYSLKTNGHQLGMKFDMSGSAIALETTIAIAKSKSNKNVLAIGLITDNCIGYGSTFVESVVKSYEGRFVEINNTDAEGRLVLADGLAYVAKNYKVNHIVDIATLTGSVSAALGANLTGVFTNNDQLFNDYKLIGESVGELYWQLPIQKENYDNMDSLVADIKNASTNRNYGVGNAAAFLETFVGKNKWIHFDIAGTATIEDKISTGICFKTLLYKFK